MNKVVGITSSLIATGSVGAGIIYFSTNNSQQKNKSETPNISNADQNRIAKTSKAISEWLSEDQKTLIGDNEDENSVWKPKWDEFKKKYQNKQPEEAWAIEQWNTKKDNDEGLKEFKKLCAKNGSEKIEAKEGDLYEKVKEYCTK